ncbi:MAG: methyl-accepting chemotaxis protein [Pararhodobacter sp.]
MFNNIRIATRIGGGFFIILALLTGLAFFAYSSTDRLGDLLADFKNESALAVETANVRTNVMRARMAANAYLAQPSEQSMNAMFQALEMVEDASDGLVSAGLVSAVALDASAETYASLARRFLEANEPRLQALARVESLGIEHRRNIGRLNEMLEERTASNLAYTALRASEAFLVTRVRVDRFLAGGQISEFESAAGPLQNTENLLSNLASASLMTEERALLVTAREGITTFRQAIDAARDAELHRRQTLGTVVAAVPPLMEAMDTLVAEIDRRMAAIEASSNETVRSTVVTLITGAALILALGAAIAALLSLDITRSLRRTVNQTRRLAEGDLSTEITGAKARNELGDLARALEVFKKNAQETHRLEAEAEAKRNEDAARQEREMAKQQRVVNDISAGLNRLAAGDLTRHIDSPANNPFPPEYDALRNAFNEVVDQLAGIVSRIGSVADSVRSGSGEINAASQDLSSRAETQAATLEQSAAALNELTESVRSTAQRAASAEKASQDNRAHAETGAQVVREAVNAMRGIEKSSDQITRIIGVIDDIAFQTNLLALNAGVEAARAGEAGRGFAVVASEVRGLAQRASESAREIKTLIRESATQVEAGSALVGRTGESLEEILKRASEVSGLMGEIAVAASEQASGLDEINAGVNQLDQVTQQNAAVAEETTAAATSLLQKAEELARELSGFQTSGRGGSQVADLGQVRARAAVPAARIDTPPPAARPAKAAANGLWQDF